MGDTNKRMDIAKLFSLADDLTGMLNDGKDGDNLMQCLDNAKSLRYFCEINAHETNVSLKGYQKKINECKEKIEKINVDVVTDSELDDLRAQLEEKMQMEYSLQKEFREVADQLGSLDQQRVSFEKQWQLVKQRKKDVQMSQDSLSMCASVTGIIPDITDKTKISGYLVERSKKRVERFEFDRGMSKFDVCNSLWRMASQ